MVDVFGGYILLVVFGGHFWWSYSADIFALGGFRLSVFIFSGCFPMLIFSVFIVGCYYSVVISNVFFFFFGFCVDWSVKCWKYTCAIKCIHYKGNQTKLVLQALRLRRSDSLLQVQSPGLPKMSLLGAWVWFLPLDCLHCVISELQVAWDESEMNHPWVNCRLSADGYVSISKSFARYLETNSSLCYLYSSYHIYGTLARSF